MERTTLDVAILGGGLAGSFLARQLRRRAPALSVGVFEKFTEPGFKVGEATVEIAAHYMMRRLALTTYLYDQHLPKNGLRFFFDTPAKDAELEAMSEIGSVSLPFHPAFQLDRARLERDLLRMNRESGVLVRTGVAAKKLAPGTGGAPHRFAVAGPDGESEVECRWLVDASGRAGLLAREKGLQVEEPGLPHAAVWGRFEGVADLDDLGSEAFRQRVQFTSRTLSTVHFCYPGYWIWLIPLRNGITSIGVVGVRDVFDRDMRSEAGFQAFLRSHRALAGLLTDAKQIDCMSFSQLAYGTRQFFDGADRWGCTGESAAFADPLYSPGSDFIALENDFLTDLVVRDAAGESSGAIAGRARLYERFMQFRTEAAMRLYRDLYGLLGSFELVKLKYEFDLATYYNLWVSAYMRDEHLDAAALKRQLRERRFVLRSMANFAALFRRVERHLRETGRYYDGNLGRFAHGLERIDFVPAIGLERRREEVLDTTLRTFNNVRRRALELLDCPEEAARELPVTAFITDRPLV